MQQEIQTTPPGNIYALSERLTPAQTQAYLTWAVLLALLGLTLVKHRTLGNIAARFSAAFTKHSSAGSRSRRHV